MLIRDVKLTAMQPAAMELTWRDRYTDNRLHYDYCI